MGHEREFRCSGKPQKVTYEQRFEWWGGGSHAKDWEEVVCAEEPAGVGR